MNAHGRLIGARLTVRHSYRAGNYFDSCFSVDISNHGSNNTTHLHLQVERERREYERRELELRERELERREREGREREREREREQREQGRYEALHWETRYLFGVVVILLIINLRRT
jgi:hypothetical protein